MGIARSIFRPPYRQPPKRRYFTPSTPVVGIEFVDTGTVGLVFTPSAVEYKEPVDSGTVSLLFTPSGVDIRERVDINTVPVVFTPSATEIRERIDASTVPVLFTPSATEFKETLETGTVYLDLQPETTAEFKEPVDTGTVSLKLTPSVAEFREITDTGTVPVLFTPSAVETREITDTGTVPLLFTPSAVEIRERIDAATVPLALTPSAVDIAQFADAAEVYLDLVPSGVDVYTPLAGVEYTDSTTVGLLLTPSALEAREIADTGTVSLKLTPSVTEAREITDVGTILFKLTPSVSEQLLVVEAATVKLTLAPSAVEQLVDEPLVPVYPVAVQGPTLGTNLYVWITWGRNDRTITSYKIYKDNSLLTTINVTGDTWDKCAFKDTAVSAGTTYEYEVSAVNALGESDRSEIVDILVRSDAQIGATVNVDSQTGPTDREKINQALLAAKVAGGGIVQFGNSTYILGDLTSIGDILSSAPKNVVWRGHASGTIITTSDVGDTENSSNTENMARVQGTATAISPAVLAEKINEGDKEVVFTDASWAIVGRKVRFDQSAGSGIGTVATSNGVTMDPGTPRDNSRSYDINEIVSVDTGTDIVTFKYPFSAEFVIDSGELNGRALPTIHQYADHVGCGVENITFRGHADQGTDETLFLVHVVLLNMPEFFFAECSFDLAGKSFVLHQDTGYVNYVGCKGYEQGAAADSESSASAVYSLNLNHAPNCQIIDSDFGLGYNPIEATLLTSGASDANTTSYSSASITPSANKLILLTVLRNEATLATTPTVTGNGLTWDLEEVVAYDTAGGIRADLRVYRAMGASPTAGVVTIDFGANTQQGCQWSIAEFDGVDTSGTNGSGAVVQSVTAQGTAAGLTVNMAAFARRSHATFGAFAHQTNEATTPGTDFTELSDTGYVNPAENLQTQFRKDNDTTVAASWATSAIAGAIGIELRAGNVGLNRRSNVTMNEGNHRTIIRHSRFYETHTYNVNTHGLGASDWVIENSYFEPTPFTQRGAIFVGNSSWGFDHQGIIRNNKCVSGPRLVSGQENTYGVRIIANITSGLAANALVSVPCVVETYGWDGPDTPPELTGSIRWTIRENVDVGLSGSHVRLEQIESPTYPTDAGGAGGGWVRDVVHDSNSWNNTSDIVKPTNVERVPYDTSGGFPAWSSEVFDWQLPPPPPALEDADTVRLSLTPSAIEVREITDSATVPFKLTPQAVELREITDTNTVPLKLTPSVSEQVERVDSSTVPLKFTITSVDTKVSVEADTVRLTFTPSGVDTRLAVDDAIVPLKLTPSGEDLYGFITFTDSATVSLKLTPSSLVEVLQLYDTFLVGTPFQRWTAEVSLRWTSAYVKEMRFGGSGLSHWTGSTMSKWVGSSLPKWAGVLSKVWSGKADRKGEE